MTDLKSRFRPGSFAYNAAALMTGTAIAQAISIAVAPILTRLYVPEEYGILAVYLSVTSIIGVISTLAYDIAIMLPEKDEDAINLMGLSGIITIGTSFFLLAAVCLLNGPIANALNAPEISGWLYWMPFTVFLGGVYSIVLSWANREKQYERLSLNKIYLACITTTLTLSMGYAGFGASGLILSGIIGQTAGTVMLGWQMWKKDKGKVALLSKRLIWTQARRYRQFPLYSLPSAFLNIAANQVPVMLMKNFFESVTVGSFSMTQRVLGAPVSLISQSILGVFRERAAREYNTYGNCQRIYAKTFKSLSLLSGLPFLLLFLTSPWLFPIVFGEKWRTAGEYAQILSPLFFLRFTSSPLSYVFFIAEKQKYNLYGQAFLFVSSIVSIGVGGYLGSPKIGIVCFSISYSLFYIFYLFASYRFAKGIPLSNLE